MDSKLKNKDTLNIMEIEELSKGGFIDSTFLGFRFGMSRDEFTTHTMILQEDEIIFSENEVLKYPFTLRNGKTYYGEILANFHNEKLYEVGLRFDLGLENSFPAYNSIMELYDEKYNSYTNLVIREIELGVINGKIWLNKNLKIELQDRVTDIRVKYINNPIKRLIRNIDSTEINKRKGKTIQHI